MEAKSNNRILGLDVLRVYAIILVVACHTGVLSSTSGGIGNKIFFSLSGFLVYFSLKRLDNLHDMVSYYIKKFIRIVPLYWSVVMISWIIFPGILSIHDFKTPNSLFLNLFFLKSFGHLWFLQHLMLMYLLAPVLYLVHLFISRIVNKVKDSEVLMAIVSSIVLVGIALLEKKFLTSEVLTLSGEGSHSQFQIWIFIFGFATAIVGDKVKNVAMKDEKFDLLQKVSKIAVAYTAAFILFFTISVIPTLNGEEYLPQLGNEYLRTILSCLACFLCLLSSGSFGLNKKRFTVIFKLSDLSFGIYLWHFFLLGYFSGSIGWRYFLVIYFISTCLSWFTYTVVERHASKLLKCVANQ